MWAISKTAAHKAFLIEVKKARRLQGVKQKQIAYELSMTQSNYSQIENGATDLKLTEFIFLCKRLKISALEFLNLNS